MRGYSPEFFGKLWQERIAVITYRKNVKDQWNEDDFKEYRINIDGIETEMVLCEKVVELDGVKMREVRRLTESRHQTSIITTNKKLPLESIAVYMFSRWCQENFFRYMRQEYDIDRICQYATAEIDGSITVVNPDHSKLSNQIKKTTEKINRRSAKLYKIQQENCLDNVDNTSKYEKDRLRLLPSLKYWSKKMINLKRSEKSILTR